MGEWHDTTLGELVTSSGGGIQTGPFGSQLHASDYVADGIPSVMPANIGENRIVEDGIARITEEDAQRLSRHRLVPGDIVYSRRGDVERRALVREENAGWLCGTGCLRVHFGPEPTADAAFVSYALGTEWTRSWIVQQAVGATMLNLNTGILASVPLSVPKLGEQRAIAEVLGALDDKIAANTRLAATAHELAMCEFRRLETRTVERGVLRDLTELEYGKALPAAKRIAGVVHVYGSGGKSGSHETALVAGPGVILGRKGSVGMTYWSSADFFPIDTTFYAVPRAGVPMEYIYFLLRSLEFGDRNSDSAVPGLNRNDAYSARVAIPEPTELQAFEAVASTLLAVHIQAVDENLALATTRDALLPQLMSGKLRVREAAEMAGL